MEFNDIKELVKKKEKYKLHDLRENPKDFPKELHNVLLYIYCGISGKVIRDIGLQVGNVWHSNMINIISNINNEVIAWRELPDIEEE